MKVKELIALLQEIDPDGEEEVSVGKSPITHVTREPMYYDGCYCRPITENGRQGLEYVSDGSLIVIESTNVERVLMSDPKAPIKYGYESARKLYEERNNKIRKEMYDVWQDNHVKHFVDCVVKRLGEDTRCPAAVDPEGISSIRSQAHEWAMKNIEYDELIPKDIIALLQPTMERSGISINAAKELQWNREIQISKEGDVLTFTRLVHP